MQSNETHWDAEYSDPAPWRHVDGERVADPFAPGSRQGGYTFAPRVCYGDYPTGYVSTRSNMNRSV